MSIKNINTIITGSVEKARIWIKEGDEPNDVYQALAPAIFGSQSETVSPICQSDKRFGEFAKN